MKVAIQYDSVDKTCVVTVDGKKVENLMGVSFGCKYDYKTDKMTDEFSMNLHSAKSNDDGSEEMHMIRASADGFEEVKSEDHSDLYAKIKQLVSRK